MLCCSFGNRTKVPVLNKSQSESEKEKRFECRKSIRTAPVISRIPTAEIVEDADGDSNTAYRAIISEAKRSIGHGAEDGSFPEEWDAHLLVDCGRDVEGNTVVLFCPAFLEPFVDDAEEMDLAFKYILLKMDGVAMKAKYVFIYCYLGMDWSKPKLAQYIRQSYDILPRKYSKHLQKFYILHPTAGFKASMWGFWGWTTQHLWNKITYMNSLDDLCQALQPEDEGARGKIRQHFPQMTQRNDAEFMGNAYKPVTFGVPLLQLCSDFGVDFTDRTTGRWYPCLPPIVIFLCETMEREAADDGFSHMFSESAAVIYSLLGTIDAGKPLPRDISHAALWCALKMFLDCLPSPLLSNGAMAELRRRGVGPDDHEKQRKFLIDTFSSNLCTEAAYLALYVASFLHTMCQNSTLRFSSGKSMIVQGGDAPSVMLTPALCAKVFVTGFFGSRTVNTDDLSMISTATNVLKFFIEHAEETELWKSRITESPPAKWYDAQEATMSSSSSSDED